MPTRIPFSILIASLGLGTAMAQVFLDTPPANRSAAGAYSLRNLALGEPRFANPALYNLYDQGGSAIGLLETRKERLSVRLGMLGNNRATGGDTLSVAHSDYYLPQLSLFQPGTFGAVLYFQRESESFERKGLVDLENSASLFGLDLTAGPASGLFRFGLGAHARLGGMEYAGLPKRTVVEVPSLRLDLGSRFHPAAEAGVFLAFGGHFDSLENAGVSLERIARMSLPRYGILADLGGTEDIPAIANLALEIGTNRFFGEYRDSIGPGMAGPGVEYNTLWANYWNLQIQALYPVQAGDFSLQPAVRFAYRSETVQAFEGLEGNQNPFKKGIKVLGPDLDHGATVFGLGGNFGFKEMVTLLLEWETAGHTFKSDTTVDKRFGRFSLGLENRVDKLPFVHFPEGLTLALRGGWTWREEEKEHGGYREYQFNPFVPTPETGGRMQGFVAGGDDAAAYSALHLGIGLGLMEGRLEMEGLLSFPGQSEPFGSGTYRKASGTEFGLGARFSVL